MFGETEPYKMANIEIVLQPWVSRIIVFRKKIQLTLSTAESKNQKGKNAGTLNVFGGAPGK